MRRYLRLYRVFMENCLARESEFRANFWASVITNTGWLFFFVAFIKVVFLNTNAIAGWSEAEALTLTGSFGLVQGLFSLTAYENLARIPELVRLGTLDFVLIRPVSSQFLVSARYVKLDAVGNVLGALIVIAYGASQAGGVSPAGLLAYVLMLACALAIYYGIYMLLMTLAIWLVRIENLPILADMVFHVARYPTQIFGGWPRLIFTYIIPLAYLATYPTRALLGGLPLPAICVAGLLAVVLVSCSIGFWRFALRHYTSASS